MADVILLAGKYDLKEENRIKFSKINTTLMMCADMTTEDQFLEALPKSVKYTLIVDTLYLEDEGLAPLAKFEFIPLKLDSDSVINQIDKMTYEKDFSINGFQFKIFVKYHDLIIQTSGLQENSRIVHYEIDGTVTDAEVGDLNADGFPEVLVYTNSEGSGSYGNVIGYKVDSCNSMSYIIMPQLTDDKEASKGYMGHDKFGIISNKLVRSFPKYNKNDTNANPTGGTKQILYLLKKDKGGWKFEIEKIIDN